MAATRVYLVHQDGQPKALVRAASQSQAIRHVVGEQFEAVPADQDMLIKHLTAGNMKVQNAKKDEE